MKIKKIVILGGGTAGWITANHLAKNLQNQKGIEITLIENPNIPTIGVGEGTVPLMRETLKSFGIRETEFITECDATFKQSIKFVNWMDKKTHSQNYYHHLFESPFPFEDDLTPYWLQFGQDKTLAETVSFQADFCDAGKAPKLITNREYEGISSYAYHLDAKKFSKLLAKNATEKLGVKHLQSNIVDAELDASGALTHLITEQAENLAYDFFVDCSGFSATLIEKKLNIETVSKSDVLLTNKAIAVQVPTEPDRPIPPYTISTAHQAGWIWDIALTERRGTGFVYSDNHISEDQAYSKFDKYLVGKLAELSPRNIDMKIGIKETLWHKNCVAIGLSQGFVEPLEATALLLTDFSARLLAERFPIEQTLVPIMAKRFNEIIGNAWNKTIDFVKLHYCLSDRTDSQFWIDNRDPLTIPESLQERLLTWQHYCPKDSDFDSKTELFNVDNYLYVMFGMNFKTKVQPLDNQYISLAKSQINEVAMASKEFTNKLPMHRDLINKIKKYGLSTV
ncbi:tryptophan 7-halogenase [Catenovulum sp. SM1970]|uniref:tryptophan halogenase family protein n=1 Tax=Marinifaba aquimaris TaxID=2741323 RepID=UPI001572AA1B|nr:tryptophan halogenase family protein [Marinifaba aquimaris]NTS78659.1 tryptophan 7-halogenase [Marinifaba aquimaris]